MYTFKRKVKSLYLLQKNNDEKNLIEVYAISRLWFDWDPNNVVVGFILRLVRDYQLSTLRPTNILKNHVHYGRCKLKIRMFRKSRYNSSE